MNKLLGFDPLLFLGITNLKGDEKGAVSEKLIDAISQYIIVRIAEFLSDDDLTTIDNPNALFAVARNKIPDFDTKIKLFLEDFKKEYYNNYNNPAQI